ncbi:MAG: hypothetical protein H7A23_21630 [Leptospiraceae bacterium]|nr:hypothetical protein [Leptospiraceae bacterium]MCP5497165.1 hypothetical protein [Leptospiraceae bacterium]
MKKITPLPFIITALLVFMFVNCKGGEKEKKAAALKAYAEITVGAENAYKTLLEGEGKSKDEILMNFRNQMQDIGENAAKNNGFKDYKDLQETLTKLQNDKDLLELTGKFQNISQEYGMKLKEKFKEGSKDSEDKDEDEKDTEEEENDKDEE